MIVGRAAVITFLTLFLGLVHGPIFVALSAPPEVARVELRIDGERAADLGPPWQANVDLGPELAPHELVAVAYGKDGRRLGETRQWVNRARPQAEAAFALERNRDGRVLAARLVWKSVTANPPRSVAVTFDGYPVEARDPSRIAVPPHAASVSHVLMADLVFPGGATATAVAGFGGQRRDETERELTPFPVRVPPKAELPKPGKLDGWFVSNGAALEVAALESGPAEVHFVLAGAARQDLERLWREDMWPWPWPRSKPLELPKEARYRFVATSPTVVGDAQGTSRLFSTSEEYTPVDGPFLRNGSTSLLREPPGDPCVAESVAVSALETTVRERRRAIVLVLGEGARDGGSFDAARVRRYLSRLRVPLHVWRTSAGEVPAAADWPAAVDASTVEAMGLAFDALRKDLASQRIVWLEGRHAPSSVSLTKKATGVVEAR
jgi:hypothetical protein